MNEFIISQITDGDEAKWAALRDNTEAVEVAVAVQSPSVRHVLIIIFHKPCPEFPDLSGKKPQCAQVLTLFEAASSSTTVRKCTSHHYVSAGTAATTYAGFLKPGSGLRARHDLAKSLWTAITGKPHPHDV